MCCSIIAVIVRYKNYKGPVRGLFFIYNNYSPKYDIIIEKVKKVFTMDVMDRKAIVQVLREIAALLELKGDNPYKIRSYENAAAQMELIQQDLFILIQNDELKDIKGIGKKMSSVIEELVTNRTLEEYEVLKSEIPEGVFQMLQVPGLGPKKVKLLMDELNITDLETLQKACESSDISKVKGFGAKTVQKILEGIQFLKQHRGQTLYFSAYDTAQRIVSMLSENEAVLRIDVAGSLRRKKEAVKDIDILAASEDPENVMESFINLPIVKSVTSHGKTKSSIITQDEIAVDLRVVTAQQYPYALHHFTGSKEHNTEMRHLAKQKGYKMNEYGLFDEKEALILCSSEEEIFNALGLIYIPAELREGIGEIEAAKERKIPNLIQRKEIVGAFHIHTSYSDGANSVQEMVEYARNMGLQYIGISDHSQTAFYAHGLKKEKILEQHAEIDLLNERYNDIHIFKGIESDILPDGSLDYEDELLNSFDFIIASIHSNFNMSSDEMTARILKAVENPHTTMLGHLTGRLLLKREGYGLDIHKIIEACAQNNVIIEINANPVRLDLDWRFCKYAKEKGVMLSINPDAHRCSGLEHIEYGVAAARKGWLEAKDIVNTYSVDKVKEILAKRRKK